MGNKQARKVYDKLLTIFDKDKTLAHYLPFSALSESKLLSYFEKMIKKKVTDEEWKRFENEMNLNVIPKEASEGDKEERNKRMTESRLHSLLVSGHEEQPEILTAFQGVQLEDTLAPKLDSVQKYSHKKVLELAIALLTLIERSEAHGELKTFYQKASQYLSDNTHDIGEGSGASIGLYLSTLLIEPSKLLNDNNISSRILKMFEEIPCLAFHRWNKQNFIIEKSIGYVKQSLLSQLEESKGAPQKNIENAINTLCHIGLARGSIEDFLVAIRMMEEGMDLTEIIKRIIELDGLESRDINLKPSNQNYRIPFEHIYFPNESEWITDKNAFISSATDGKYIYFYNSIHGLVLLSADNEKIKGKLYKVKGFIEDNKKVQVLFLNKKIYCWINHKLFKLNVLTMEIKLSKKNSLFNNLNNFKLTANDHRLIIYQEEKQGEEGEEVKAEITIHNFNTKKRQPKITITHHIDNLQGITLYKNLLILTGQKKYEVVDLVKEKKICNSESELLAQATLCCNSDTGELFAIYPISEDEGFILEELKLPSIRKETIPFLDSRITKLKSIDTESPESKAKREIELLLGMTKTKKVKAPKGSMISGTENLLAVLAYRSNAAELYIANLNSKEIIKAYKCPVAVHLTTECLETLFKLLEEQFKRLNIADKKKVHIELEKLWYIIIILNSHFIALGVCDITLEDLIGIETATHCKALYKDIITSLIQEDLNEKYKVDDEELTRAVKGYINDCLKNNNFSLKVEAEEIFRQFHECRVKQDLSQIVDWLKSPDHCDLLVNKIFNQDKNALNFLNEYFELEVEHLVNSIKNFINNIKTTNNQLFMYASQVIEKIFLNSKLRKRNNEAQEVLISILPEMLYPHLKKIVYEIKETYIKYKALIMKDVKGDVGVKYSEYWKVVDKVLKDEIVILNVFDYLTIAAMGLSLSPDKLVTLAKLLVKFTNPLKELLSVFAEEKEDKEFFLKKLEETFENKEKPIEDTINTSKEYKFAEATSITVFTKESIEIPPPDENSIKIIIPSNKDPIVVINRLKPVCKISIPSSQITILASINYMHSKKNLPYNGYSLKIIPKVL